MKFNKDYNIILINLDGFRKDKVDLCPTLKYFKENSFYFSKMYTVSPYTFASLHSVFTGIYPSKHGVNGYYNIFDFKKDTTITLTEILKQVGYYTCCDIIDEVVIPKQGFDEWNIFNEESINFEQRHKELIGRLSKKKKFFLFLHYTEFHKNLVKSIIEKYKQESNDDEYFNSQKENNERYNSYLPACDRYITTIIQSLKDSGIFDKTILIFFSDHGTSIGEKKGEKFYGVFTYEYTINVFCIINIPNSQPKVISKQCRTIDILPTIVEIIDKKPDNNSMKIQGESLFSFINEFSSEDREVFVETGGLYGPWPSPEKHNVFCVRNKDKKLIYNDVPETWEFYDLSNDPKEINNIYDESSKEILYFKKRLLHYLRDNEINTKIT